MITAIYAKCKRLFSAAMIFRRKNGNLLPAAFAALRSVAPRSAWTDLSSISIITNQFITMLTFGCSENEGEHYIRRDRSCSRSRLNGSAKMDSDRDSECDPDSDTDDRKPEQS
jgi:hypothetical protein